jgi:hypothetical protein
MPRGAAARGDDSGSIKPRLARQGWIRFLTLKDLDARSRAAAFAKNLAASLESDLGNDPTAGQKQLVHRAAVISAVCEDFETRFLLGEPFELPDYLVAANCLRRVLATLGLERRARDVTPTLTEYLTARDGKPVDADGGSLVEADDAMEAREIAAPRQSRTSGGTRPLRTHRSDDGTMP